jgi:signal transduction histidine kinase
MPTTEPPPQRHFDIDASIVFQLGEGLISDSVQALIELIKNCWDADATYAKVTVDTRKPPAATGLFFGLPGYISVEDDGCGMDAAALLRGWLVISNSEKREFKAKKQETPKHHRTPLGEKGLGRLGVQRLGRNIEIYTEPKGSDVCYHVGWSWDDFLGKKTLSQISPKWEELPPTGKAGTRLIVTGLNDAGAWDEGPALEAFYDRLSQMISPYAEFPTFRIVGKINGRDLPIDKITERLRDLASLRYSITFDGTSVFIEGKLRTAYLKPQKGKGEELEDFRRLVEADEGAALANYLQGKKQGKAYGFRPVLKKGWFAGCERAARLVDIDKIAMKQDLPANPGPFLAEIDSFSLVLDPDEPTAIFNQRAKYKAYVNSFGGLRVFRDGFGIRMDEDWMGLGSLWSRGGSYYSLRPANIVGFVAISAKDNAALVEATDREGFVDTPAYRNFVAIFKYFAKFAAEAQEFVRRGYLEYKEHHLQTTSPTKSGAPQDVVRYVALSVAAMRAAKAALGDVSSRVLTPALSPSSPKLTQPSGCSDDAIIQAQREANARQRAALEETSKRLSDVMSSLSGLDETAIQLRLLETQIEILRAQLEETYQTMALGLTAEALSHEVANIADRLTDEVNGVAQHVKEIRLRDEHVLLFVEHVKATVSALRAQMAHLTPSLKFARAPKELIGLKRFLDEMVHYHAARWENVPIKLVVDVECDFVVRMSKGKLLQVLDNLILNSEYWLREGIRKKEMSDGTISIKVLSPRLIVSDNGPGITPAVEESLFEPFVTTKKNGRGLGLFVVKQLLDAEGGSISLMRRRNSSGRLYQFEIDLSGALDHGR